MSMVRYKRSQLPSLNAERADKLRELAAQSDKTIDDKDAPELPDVIWKNAKRGRFYRPVKMQASVRIDADVLEWLKTSGKGYQTRLNNILREAMLRDLFR